MKKVMKKLLFVSLFVLALSCLFAFSLTASAEVYSGKCGAEGDNVMWQFDTETGTLTLSGEGEMVDGDGEMTAGDDLYFGWNNYISRYDIRTLVIGDGITRIGSYAFEWSSFTDIQGGKDLVDIGINAFKDSEVLYQSEGRLVFICDVLYDLNDEYDPDVEDYDHFYISKKVKHMSENLFYDDGDSWTLFYEGSKSEYQKITNGYSNSDFRIKYNHIHDFNFEYDFLEDRTFIYCDCGEWGEAKDTKVKNLKAAATETRVTLTWNRLKGAEGYVVFRYDNANKKWINITDKGDFAHEEAYLNGDIDFEDIEEFKFKYDGLKSNTDYKFAVRAYVTGWDSGAVLYAPKYETVTVKTDIGKPELTITGGYECIRIDWKPVDGADGYRVYKKVNGSWQKLADTEKLTYMENGIADSKTYSYAVKAYRLVDGKKVLAGRYSSGSATAKLPNPKVTYVRDIKSVTLKWDKVTTAKGYRIYRLVNGSWKALKTTTGTSYTVTNLKAKTKYTFAVKTYTKVDGVTKWAPSYTKITLTTLDYTPLKATGIRGEYVSSSSVKLSWDKTEDAQGYYVYMYNASTKKYNVVAKTKALTATIGDVNTTKNNYFTIRTYKKVDGKVYWSGYSEKLRMDTRPTGYKAVELFNKSIIQMDYWLLTKPMNSKLFDYNDIIEVDGYYYARIKTDKIKTADDLKKHLYKYADKRIIDHWFEQEDYSLIINRNGKAYYMYQVLAGGSGGLELKYTEYVSGSFSDGKMICKLKCKIYDAEEDKYDPVTYIVEFKFQDGNWVISDVDDLGFPYGTRWTGSNYNPHNI